MERDTNAFVILQHKDFIIWQIAVTSALLLCPLKHISLPKSKQKGQSENTFTPVALYITVHFLSTFAWSIGPGACSDMATNSLSIDEPKYGSNTRALNRNLNNDQITGSNYPKFVALVPAGKQDAI